MNNIKPLGNNILLKVIEEKEESNSSIILPDNTKKKEVPMQGEVIAVGNGDEIPVKVDDKVIFRKFTPQVIKLDEEELLIIDQADMLAIIED